MRGFLVGLASAFALLALAGWLALSYSYSSHEEAAISVYSARALSNRFDDVVRLAGSSVDDAVVDSVVENGACDTDPARFCDRFNAKAAAYQANVARNVSAVNVPPFSFSSSAPQVTCIQVPGGYAVSAAADYGLVYGSPPQISKKDFVSFNYFVELAENKVEEPPGSGSFVLKSVAVTVRGPDVAAPPRLSLSITCAP